MKKLLVLLLFLASAIPALAIEDIDMELLSRMWQTGPEPLTELNSLVPSFDDYVTFESVTVVRNSEFIDMGDTIVSDYASFIKFLDGMPFLKKVDMFSTVIPVDKVEYLAERYPKVEFGWTIYIGNSKHNHVVRTDDLVFSTLHSNKSPEHTDRDFAALRFCKNMMALDIGHNACADLSFLYSMPNLRVLIIGRNSVADITPISSLHELQYLELFTNVITDLSALSELQNLLDLNICFNKISDFTPLYGLKSLERLWMYNSNCYDERYPVNPDKVKTIKKALPHCRVDSTSYVTQGGWREGERYEKIREMFRSNVFIPF